MAVTTKGRLLTLFLVTILVALGFCVGGYLFALKIGISALWAGMWGATTFIICASASWVGMRRALNNRNPVNLANPPQPSVRIISWIAGGFVIPILASVFHLGFGFLVIPLLALFHAAGLPGDSLRGPISWLAMTFSVVGAIGVWLLIWNRYKRSLSPSVQLREQ